MPPDKNALLKISFLISQPNHTRVIWKVLSTASLLHNALIKCYQIIYFFETRIQRLLDGLIFVKKRLGVHVQCMLKMNKCLYAGGNFKQNTWKKANEN